MSKIIAFANQKGGTGKTTCVVNIGAGLNQLGQRVLIVDLDPQANATYHLGIKLQTVKNFISEVLEGQAQIKEALIERNGLNVIPSSLRLAQTEANIFNATGREFLLRESLARIRNPYDFILIDCPPSLGILSQNAFVAAGHVYIPLEVEALALQGLKALLNIVDIIKARLNRELEITGIIATKFDRRKNLNREVLEKIREHFKELLFKTSIRDNISLGEAPGFGQTIFEYRPKSYGAEDYLKLCKEILRRSKRQ